MGKNLKDKVKFIWSLLSTQMQSWTEPSWHEQEFVLKGLEMNLYGKDGACSLDIVFPLSQTEFHLKEFDIKWIPLWVLDLFCYKGNIGETSEGQEGVRMGFPEHEHVDSILNRTDHCLWQIRSLKGESKISAEENWFFYVCVTIVNIWKTEAVSRFALKF